MKQLPIGKAACVKRLNHKGFTMVEMLVSFSVFCLIASFLPLLFQIIFDEHSIEGRLQRMEWEVFISQLEKEIKLSDNVEIVNGDLVLFIGEERVLFQKFSGKLRRRVNMEGHEIVLQNVDSVHFAKGENFIAIEVRDTFGKTKKRTLYSFTGWDFYDE